MRPPRHPIPSLLATLAVVPDPRKRRGVRHPLPALLGLACTAALCGYTTPTEIADFGRNHAADLHNALGFTHATMPCDGTFHYLFDDFDVTAFEQHIGAWVEQVNSAYAPPGQEALALDGKTLRGSKRSGLPGVHLLAALSQALQLPVHQQAMPLTTNEATAAVTFLRGLPLDERLVTMDAAFTQRDVCYTILEGRGDYLCCVKENQPTLLDDIQRAFTPLSPQEVLPPPDARTIEVGHGRIVERELWCDATLNAYVDWPGCEQVLRVRRTVLVKRTRAQTVEDAYYITSASPRKASPATLLQHIRGHWGIETGLHGVRDGTFREDGCKVTIGTFPQSLAILRNIAITVHRVHGTSNMAAAVRRLRAHVKEAVRYLGLSAPDF